MSLEKKRKDAKAGTTDLTINMVGRKCHDVPSNERKKGKKERERRTAGEIQQIRSTGDETTYPRYKYQQTAT